jgi:hypothetical protein
MGQVAVQIVRESTYGRVALLRPLSQGLGDDIPQVPRIQTPEPFGRAAALRGLLRHDRGAQARRLGVDYPMQVLVGGAAGCTRRMPR